MSNTSATEGDVVSDVLQRVMDEEKDREIALSLWRADLAAVVTDFTNEIVVRLAN